VTTTRGALRDDQRLACSAHATARRYKAQQATGEPPRVLGCLLGTHSARIVDIANSFEIKYDGFANGVPQLDAAFLTQKQEQCAAGCVSVLTALCTRRKPSCVLCCVAHTAFARASADKKVFPKFDVVGWYSTGAELQDADLELHRTARCRAFASCQHSPS
jgi:COP9 signalosome complex subunit 6